MPSKRRPSRVHRANGPYFPLGLIGDEYCVKCREVWPCAAEQTKRERIKTNDGEA